MNVDLVGCDSLIKQDVICRNFNAMINGSVTREVIGADGNLCDRTNVKRPKYSCWDVLDPALFDGAAEPETDHRIYVHGDVLEWIVEYINDNILDEHLRATVEEVYHHNLDGPVYLINFYNLNNFGGFNVISKNDKLNSIKNRFKYNMPWRTKPTYFLQLDSKFKDRKDQIMVQLTQIHLEKCFHASTLDVNWLYIPKIQVYEFSELLTDEQIAQIDSIFENLANSQAELYICEQFVWHQCAYNYVEVDKVAMDMCAEEWRRYDLLNDFSIDDILRLDLANKDYRDPYMNEYLDRYLNSLLNKSLPQNASNQEQYIDVPIFRLQPYVRTYFISRFYNKISNFISRNYRNIRDLYKYDIPLIRMGPETIVLSGDCPSAEEVIGMFCVDQITFNLSNYAYFSNTVFRALLNKFSWQQYNIRFDVDFKFHYECNKQYALKPIKCVDWTSDEKTIKIVLHDCAESNVVNLVKFVKYLTELFNEAQNSKFKVTLCFANCILDDYTFLEKIGNGIKEIKFKGMDISSRQIQVLSRALTQQSCVIFRDCTNITDNNVMTLLENIEFDRLWIEGENACTPGIYFRMAELVMNKEATDTVDANRFNRNMLYTKYNFYYHFDEIEFFNNGYQIVTRNRHSKKTVDLYCFMNSKAISPLIKRGPKL